MSHLGHPTAHARKHAALERNNVQELVQIPPPPMVERIVKKNCQKQGSAKLKNALSMVVSLHGLRSAHAQRHVAQVSKYELVHVPIPPPLMADLNVVVIQSIHAHVK